MLAACGDDEVKDSSAEDTGAETTQTEESNGAFPMKISSLTASSEDEESGKTITFEDVVGDLIYTNKSNKYVVYPYNKLTNNILYNYRNYYSKYGKIVTAYSDKVTMRGI